MQEELFNQYGWRLTLDTASLPDGRTKQSVRVHRCDSVHILAFPKPGHILLLKEYRPFYQEYIWMLPSGKVDKETDVLTAAGRELQEETGFAANIMTPYGQIYTSDSIVITNNIFLASDLYKSPLPQDDDELIEVFELPIKEAIDRVFSSPRIHSPSVVALLKYAREHNL
ncbi:NUDIX hydrolase [Candidatus Peribacteria bacterium]|nr:MAG: NUDIX hydrolase [Candidatus Peribacteria bacterium]